MGLEASSAQAIGTVVGGKRDATGTMYRRARYYDPQTGRFTQEDPIGLAGGLNLYGYAGGDPVNYADPSGNSPILIGAGIGAIIGAGIYAATTPAGQRSWGGFLGYTALGAGVGAGLGYGTGVLTARAAAAKAAAGGAVGEDVVVTAGGGAASVQASAATAATLIPPAGHKMAQMYARWGGTGGAAGLMKYAESFVETARATGNVVVGQVGSGANAVTNGVIYRVGNSYLVTDASGKLLSYVHSATAGRGIVLEYIKLGGGF